MSVSKRIFNSGNFATILEKGKLKDVIDSLPKSSLSQVQKTDSVFSAIKPLRESANGAVLVAEGKQSVGIFTQADLVYLMLKEVDLKKTMVGKEMSPFVVTGSFDMPIVDGIHLLHDNSILHLPIAHFLGDSIDNDTRVEHMITSKDILSYLMKVSTNISNNNKKD